MTWIPNVFRRRKLYNDLSEEIRLHIEERTEQLMREGMSPKEAEREACVAFGNLTLLEERSREVWQWATLESIWGDVRLALRQLRRSPGFTIAAVLTLALAIGANAVVFGILDALILRPLNVPQPHSLYTIERGPDKEANESYPDYLDLRDRNHSFDAVALYTISTAGLDTGKNPSQVMGYEVSGNYFDALRIQGNAILQAFASIGGAAFSKHFGNGIGETRGFSGRHALYIWSKEPSTKVTAA